MSSASVFSWKAGLPVTISYRIVPNAKMSVRASAWPPANCSGAMYGAATDGTADSDGIDVRVTTDADMPGWLSSLSLATPKSRSRGPLAVSITVDGFNPPCVTPCRCALSSASAIAIPISNAS